MRVFVLGMAVSGFAMRIAMAVAIACGFGHGRAQDQKSSQRTDDDDCRDQQHMLAGQAALKLGWGFHGLAGNSLTGDSARWRAVAAASA